MFRTSTRREACQWLFSQRPKHLLGDLQRGILECTDRTRGAQRGNFRTDTTQYISLLVGNPLSATHLVSYSRFSDLHTGTPKLFIRNSVIDLIIVPIITKLTQHLCENRVSVENGLLRQSLQECLVQWYMCCLLYNVHRFSGCRKKYAHQQAIQHFLSNSLYPCSLHKSTKRMWYCQISRKRKERVITLRSVYGNFSLFHM